MTLKKYKIEVFHETSPRDQNLVDTFYVEVDLKSERDPREFVFTRTRLVEEI